MNIGPRGKQTSPPPRLIPDRPMRHSLKRAEDQ